MWIRKLVDVYLSISEKTLSELSRQLGVQDLWTAHRERLIPDFGECGGFEYSFHGSGVLVEGDGSIVDVEFGSGGVVGGFDSWRLHVFSEDNPGWVGVRSVVDIEAAILALAASGLVEKSSGGRLWVRTAAWVA